MKKDTEQRGEVIANLGLLETISQFRAIIGPAWEGKRPLIKLFETNASRYLYDVGTNRVYSCSPIEYQLLSNLATLPIHDALNIRGYSSDLTEVATSLRVIEGLIKEQGVLMATRVCLRTPGHLDTLLRSSLAQIILETTEKCNLRCRYCIYNPSYGQKRNHGTRDMPLEIAFRAIDHLAQSSSSREKVAISFYGGEPLLRYSFIDRCVTYAKSNIPERKLAFSLTTNGTLLTREMARFFADNGFGVHVSIDGPEEIHDENRIFPDGCGSFNKAKRGMDSGLSGYYLNKISWLGSASF